MRRTWITGLLAVLLGQPAFAQPSDPMADVSHDPMELARAVDRMGDEAVLSHLRDGPHRLTAVHASVWMRGPEQALEPLSALAVGRDPALAPAAMRASVTIARQLDAGTLFLREVPADELDTALSRYRTLTADETARPDLRAAAQVVVAQLTDAGAGGADRE